MVFPGVEKSMRVKILLKFHFISERFCFSADLELIMVNNKIIPELFIKNRLKIFVINKRYFFVKWYQG